MAIEFSLAAGMKNLHHRMIYLALLLVGCGGPPTTAPVAPQFAWTLKDETYSGKQQNLVPSVPVKVVGTDRLDVGLTVTDTGGIRTVVLTAQAVQVQCGYSTGFGNLKKGAAVFHKVGAPVNAVLGQQIYTAPPSPQPVSAQQIFLISVNTPQRPTTSPCSGTIDVGGNRISVGVLSGSYVFTAFASAYQESPHLSRTSIVTLKIQ